ncbi:MAG: adenylyltransferase, partial [Candidatus Neomarinimicrobiota bacterium]
MSHSLIEPHGGTLVNLMIPEADREAVKKTLLTLPSWTLNDRQLCDLELLLNGGFSPLRGFMNRADYEAVLSSMRLADGTLWPMPITLDITEAAAETLQEGDTLVLRDPEGFALALLDVTSIWTPDRREEAVQVFGTDDDTHPAVN